MCASRPLGSARGNSWRRQSVFQGNARARRLPSLRDVFGVKAAPSVTRQPPTGTGGWVPKGDRPIARRPVLRKKGAGRETAAGAGGSVPRPSGPGDCNTPSPPGKTPPPSPRLPAPWPCRARSTEHRSRSGRRPPKRASRSDPQGRSRRTRHREDRRRGSRTWLETCP